MSFIFNQPRKFSLIGTGYIMPVHVDAIVNHIGGKIIDIVNTAHGEDTWKQAVENPHTDCIAILTPNDLHFEMALSAAQQNKIVLCEKPLVIKSDHAKILVQHPHIFTVLQLRYHPLVKQLKQEVSSDKDYEIDMDISVYRDENYYKSWKGQKERSGGILFNLGIHYFDILSYVFGDPLRASVYTLDEKTGTGILEGTQYQCRWKISTDASRDQQHRIFTINSVEWNFSSKDNLSHENLHRYVYEDLLQGNGVSAKEMLSTIQLIEKLSHGA